MSLSMSPRRAAKLLLFALLAHPGNVPAADGKIIINAHPQPEYGLPIPFRKIPGTAGTLALEIVGGRLYTLEDNGLSIYNIDNAKHPKKLGHIGGMGNVRQLRVRGKTAFLTSRQCGLWAVDVSDESHPRILSNFDAAEMSTGLDVAGNVAFIGNRVYGIQCVDVSDPARMKNLSTLPTDESQSVCYANGWLLSGDWAGGEVTVIDVADPSAPMARARIHLDGYGDGLAVRGNTLFASTGQHKKSGPEEDRHGAGHGLDIFDISDPLKPVKLSRVSFPRYYFGPCDYWTPRLSANYCFASDTINGLFLLDIADLKNPRILGNLVLPKADPENPKIGVPYAQIMDPAIAQGDPVSSIAVGDGVLYISGNYTGIYLAEFPGKAKLDPIDKGPPPQLPAKPYLGQEEGFISSGPAASNPVRAVAVHGDIAYTANVWDGVKIHRLSDDGITEVGQIDIDYAADVKRSGNRLYVAEGQNGIGVYQIKSPTEVVEIGRLNVLEKGLNFAQFLWAFDSTEIVAATCAGSRINFVDFSNPKEPKIILSEAGSQLLYGSYGGQALVKQRYFALTRHVGGLMLFDLADNSAKKVWHDGFPLCSQTGSIAAMGDVFLTMRGGGYAFFDPEKPVATTKLERLKFPGQDTLPQDAPDDSPISKAMFPKTDWDGLPNYDPGTGKLAVLNRTHKNIRIYDFSDKSHPKLLKHHRLHSNPYAPAFWKGRVLLPGGYSGLLLEK
ncbi:hypothetical protein DES53_11292 [Roseimicrobium gellanilyticum]|uniref:LVIVD repeat-containing protein n=2 Tax=Roseimicrobium gellanilyticum TaxID=748857 RepID=A0A366H990_9BACT|nr:hypothetical protein DES53_11292 [Roseimicrobium gellanilyticum]